MSGQVKLSPPLAVSDKSTAANKTGSWRFEKPVFVERAAPCNEACPLGQDINAVMVLQARGETQTALAEIMKENPFPGLCGLACPAPCERACNRGRLDGPVAIRALERFAAENAGSKPKLETAPASGLSVAVIGRGLAALSGAWFLIRLGHRVTLFNIGADGADWTAQPELTQVWQRERAVVIAAGVAERSLETVSAAAVNELAQEYDGLFIEPGTGLETAAGAAVRSRDFLRRAKTDSTFIGRRPVVVGSGRRAWKTVSFLVEAGLEPTVISQVPESEEAGLSSRAIAHWSTEILGLVTDSGLVRGLACRRESEQFQVEADQVILCLGQRNDLDFQPPLLTPKAVVVSPPETAGDENLSVAGLIALGKGAALGLDLGLKKRSLEDIEQAAVGVRGALSLTAWLEPDSVRRRQEVVPFRDLNLASVKVDTRTGRRAEQSPLSPNQALNAARRCLNCGVCNLCGKCEEFCPDLSVDIDLEAGTRNLDYDHCKGCGICVEECPRGAIEMRPQ